MKLITEYGNTLLTLVKCANGKKPFSSVATTMSGNMKRMKERISMIHSTIEHYAFASWLAVIGIIFLTGCSFIKGDLAAADENR